MALAFMRSFKLYDYQQNWNDIITSIVSLFLPIIAHVLAACEQPYRAEFS